MPRQRVQARKPQQSKPSEFFDKYDAQSLIAALNTFENQLGWDLFKSFIYYQAAVHSDISNGLVQQTGKTMEACAAGAKADVLREIIDQFMEQLKRKVVGGDGVVETPLVHD